MRCDACQQVLSFPRNVSKADVPCRMVCELCGHAFQILDPEDRRYALLPKIPMSEVSKGNWIYAGGIADQPMDIPLETVLEQESQVPDGAKTQSFAQRNAEYGSLFLAALQGVNELRNDLRIVAEKIVEEHAKALGEQWCIESWNPRLMYHFLMNPVAALPTSCLDQSIADRCRYLLCPKFYSRIHGFPIGLHGGFYAQALTPYAMMGFPLEIHLAETLGIKPATKLRIAGSKVIGDNLFREWPDIDGAVPDEDHSHESPSIAIKDRRLVRTWIAKNGGNPWPATDIRDQFFPYHEDMLAEDCDIEAIMEFHKTFSCTGRMVLAWDNVKLARMAVSVVGHGLRTIKMILSDSTREVNWHEGIDLQFANKKLFVYETTENFSEIPYHADADRTGLLVVDATDIMPSLEFWHWLHCYEGPLVILLREPFLDTFDENEFASAIYSLVHSASVLPDKKAWHTAWRSFAQNPPESISRALDSLRVNWGRRD